MKTGVIRWLTIASVVVFTTGAAYATPINDANLVQNVNFSSPYLTSASSFTYQWQNTNPIASPWTFSETGAGVAGIGSALNYSAPPDGASQVAFLQLYNGSMYGGANNGTSASISQTIGGINPGSWYTLSFDVEGMPGGQSAPIVASIDGMTIDATPKAGTWTPFTTPEFQATGSTETLTFLSTLPADWVGTNYNLNTAISNVALVDPPHPNPVPEGGSALSFLLLAMLASLGALRLGKAEAAA